MRVYLLILFATLALGSTLLEAENERLKKSNRALRNALETLHEEETVGSGNSNCAVSVYDESWTYEAPDDSLLPIIQSCSRDSDCCGSATRAADCHAGRWCHCRDANEANGACASSNVPKSCKDSLPREYWGDRRRGQICRQNSECCGYDQGHAYCAGICRCIGPISSCGSHRCSYSETRGRNCYNYARITVDGFRGNDVTVETCQSLCTNHDDCVKINYYSNGICSRCGVPSRCYLISSTANSRCYWSRSSTANTYTKGSCETAIAPTTTAYRTTTTRIPTTTLIPRLYRSNGRDFIELWNGQEPKCCSPSIPSDEDAYPIGSQYWPLISNFWSCVGGQNYNLQTWIDQVWNQGDRIIGICVDNQVYMKPQSEIKPPKELENRYECSSPGCAIDHVDDNWKGGYFTISIKGDFDHDSEYAEITVNGVKDGNICDGPNDQGHGCFWAGYYKCGRYYAPSGPLTIRVKASPEVDACSPHMVVKIDPEN